MDSWVWSVITLGASTLFTTVVGLIVKHYFSKYLKIREEKDIELRALRDEKNRREHHQDMSQIVADATAPIAAKIDLLDAKMDKVEDGTLSTLRNDILMCYYNCVSKGYRNDHDYQNMHHMFESYKALNGNSYVADIVKRFDEDLPTKEEYKGDAKRAHKKKEEA